MARPCRWNQMARLACEVEACVRSVDDAPHRIGSANVRHVDDQLGLVVSDVVVAPTVSGTRLLMTAM